MVAALVAAVMLSACSSTGKGRDARLGSLKKRDLEIRSQELPKANKYDAKFSYKEFARNTKNQELRVKAMERLADIELETSQDEQFKAAEARERQLKAAKPNITEPVVVDPKGDNDYAKVAQQYEKLLKRYPDDKDKAQTLYQLARAYDLSGQMEKSLKAMNRLMKEFPNNRHAEEVQFRRGETYFSLKNFKKAARSYADVINNKDSQFYKQALYKHGWSLFKQGELDQALVSFYKLLDVHFKSGRQYEQLSKSEKEIVDDVLRVTTLAFSFKDGADSIKAFSKSYGERHYEAQLYQRLSQLYKEQERFRDSAASLLSYVKANPNNRNAPMFMVDVINTYESSGFAKLMLTSKADFVTQYALDRPFWRRHERGLVEEVSPHIKKHLADLARHYHAQAQKTKKASDYKTAAHWYRQFVDSFPADKETANMNFLLAETLLETRDYQGAKEQYTKTAYDYPKSKQSAEAGYAALLAGQSIIKTLREPKKTAERHNAVEQSLRFVREFPEDKRAPNVLLKTSEELLELNRLGEASAAAQQLASFKTPAAKKLQTSALAIIAKAEFDLGNHQVAEQALLARLSSKGGSREERRAHLERLAAAIYKQGELAREQGNYQEAVEHFLRISKVAGGSPISATAEYDAAAVLAQQENWPATIKVLGQFLSRYPQHEFVKPAREKLAVAYEKDENWAQAAVLYTRIAQDEPDPERKRDLLWLTAELQGKANNENGVIAAYKNYVSTYPLPVEQAMEARIRLADIYKNRKDRTARKYWLKEIIAASDAMPEASDRVRFLAANATLELAEPKFRAYRSAHLVQPLKVNLKKKKDLMQETIQAYTKAAEYGIESVTTASTYKIAEIYRDLGKSLFSSERPKGLSSTELEQYDLLLEEQAYPFEEKAIEIHETNAERVVAGVYDQWVKKSMSALQKLNPARYRKVERSELVFVQLK